MRSRILLFIISLCIPAPTVFASFEHRGQDAKIEAMGGAGVALKNSPFGIFYNPASGVTEDNWSAGFSYAVPFGESSLDSFHGALQASNLPFDRNGSAGISWQHYGASFYSETCTYVTYATKVAGPVRTGISAGLLERDTDEYGSDSALGINVGALATLSPYLSFGVAVFSVNRPRIGNSGEKIPSITFAGASYRPGNNVLLAAAVEKQEERNARIRSGGEVQVLSFLSLRAGFSTEPSTFSGGAGLTFRNIQGDFSFVRHPELGTGSWYTMRVSF